MQTKQLTGNNKCTEQQYEKTDNKLS